MSVYSWVWEWGGSLKGELLRKCWRSKHFDQLWLRRVGLFVELEVNNSFSSNSSEWVPSTPGVPDLEHLKQKKMLKQLAQLLHELPRGWLILASRWSIGVIFVFVFGTCCCALCVLFLFSIWGPHGKELLNSFLCELPLCPCKVLFLSKCCKLHFHYAPSHLIYCKNIKRLFPSGTASEVLIIADIFLRCKKKFKIKW